MSHENITALQRQLNELEVFSRGLRAEVDLLTSTDRTIEIGRATSQKAAELRHSHESSPASSTQRRRRRVKGDGGVLPHDFLDGLVQKAGSVDILVKEHKRLEAEKADILRILTETTTLAQEEEQEFVSLLELAGADEDGKSALMLGIRKKNEYTAALQSLIQAYRERESTKNFLTRLQGDLQEVAAHVEDTRSAEEQLLEAKDVLAEKRDTLNQLRAERYRLSHGIAHKDLILDRPVTGPTPEELLRSANYDRSVALYEKSKEEDQIKVNELAVRHRAMEIAKSAKRLEMIGDAVAGNGLDEEERVDVELVEELMSEIKGLYDLEVEARAKAEMLDAEIERMEYRGGALELTTDSTQKEMGKIEKDHKRYMKSIQRELSSEQQANNQNISKLEREVESLRSKVSQSASRRRSAATSAQQNECSVEAQ
ncbi:hypothetical protein STCU_00769 [Strigomonas culicis]|nr:hypothetical protein STCU_00769 [Strigomonas culicis]|eukprot:EPY36072.1 hypothetical protein STCU_00769 [Strigomonas culicis]